jgi:hypothetical protein
MFFKFSICTADGQWFTGKIIFAGNNIRYYVLQE